jgi:lipopolysaccharide biosynthesis glycosyltransferase
MTINISQPIPIFYATDDNYAHYLTVSIASLIANANPQRQYKIFILQQKLSKDNQRALRRLSTSNVKIQLVPMGKRIARLADEHFSLRGDYETLTVYFRLFIPQMFPEYERAIYLDADSCVLTDIAELYEQDLHGQYLGAVVDKFAQMQQLTIDYVTQVLGLSVDRYFNSGMLLMDLQKLRAAHFVDEFLHFLNTYHVKAMAADQDYLNTICQRRFMQLDDRWNTLPPVSSGAPLLKQPGIVHYCFNSKPWHYQNIPYEEYFWQYAKPTPYYQEFLTERAAYAPVGPQREQASMKKLFSLGQKLLQEKHSFKYIYEQGKEHPL